MFANTLEIDEQLVSNIAIILQAFKCKKELKLDELETFCWKNLCHYYKIYPWVRMSPTLHKLFKHGCQICRKFPVPIAFFVEDVLMNRGTSSTERTLFLMHGKIQEVIEFWMYSTEQFILQIH